MQTLPDKFTPPAFWGQYPSFGQPQTATINTAAPMPPWEDGPGYTAAGGQKNSTINPGANPVTP